MVNPTFFRIFTSQETIKRLEIMKKYQVSVDIVMNKYVEVEAENDDDAANKVDEMLNNSPYDYAHSFSHYVGHEVISTEEIK